MKTENGARIFQNIPSPRVCLGTFLSGKIRLLEMISGEQVALGAQRQEVIYVVPRR